MLNGKNQFVFCATRSESITRYSGCFFLTAQGVTVNKFKVLFHGAGCVLTICTNFQIYNCPKLHEGRFYALNPSKRVDKKEACKLTGFTWSRFQFVFLELNFSRLLQCQSRITKVSKKDQCCDYIGLLTDLKHVPLVLGWYYHNKL